MKWHVSDTINFLSHLSLKKIFNLLKLVSSFFITKWTSKPVQWGLPMTLSIEPTTACNLRCPECPSGLRSFTRATGNLKQDFFRQTIDQLSESLIYLIFYFQGEPYINPNFLEMVRYANDQGLYTITSTNGHFLDDANCQKTIESGLDRIIISIDGTTQETYQNYRIGGSLETVTKGARNLVKWKKALKSSTPHIIFQYLVVKPNEHQIPEIYKLAQEVGADEVKLKTAQIYDYKKGNPLIPDQDQYSRYRKQANGEYVIKNELLNHCWKLWHACVITWDGLVIPCCFDKDATHKLGNLKERPFEQIWKGQQYFDFRKQLLLGRDKIDICNNCTEGCKVWA